MLLRIRDLSVAFDTPEGPFQAIDGIDLDIREKETLAIVGESGCGKSVLAYAVMRLLDDVATVTGLVRFMGQDIYSLRQDELRQIRGKRISLIPQSPSIAFNPVLRIGHQLVDMIKKTGIAKNSGARRRALDFLEIVGFADSDAIFHAYPHRLSGGMCEAALISMAVSVGPKLIIADEPTKGLDVFSREKILSVLHEMTGNASMVMITHDLMAAAMCDRIAVMYAGEIVEEGNAWEVLASPRHFYTRGLLDAHPARGMKPIRGFDAQWTAKASGCRFRTRCDAADDACERHPVFKVLPGGWKVRCHHA